MKKYETLDGTPIETDDGGWFDNGNVYASPEYLEGLVQIGWIRKSKLTFQELAAKLGHPFSDCVGSTSVMGRVLQRIIDKDLVDQILADD